MIAVDTNVLVYSHRPERPQNKVAFELVATLAEGAAPWAIPWPCIYEFYSVATNPRIWGKGASSIEQTRAQIDLWLPSPSLLLLHENTGFIDVLYLFTADQRVVGAKIHDARIAALCNAHGVTEFLTADRDFSLFPSLKTRNPFA